MKPTTKITTSVPSKEIAPVAIDHPTPAEMSAKVQKLVSENASITTIHNVLLQAQQIASTLRVDPVITVQSQSGYNAGGFRKPLMQAVAQAIGVVPVLRWVETNSANPKQVGQQPAFFGPSFHAQLASAVYSALYSWINVQGNKELRLARVAGHASGKSGQAGDRLQQDVYNQFACKILDTLGKITAVPVAEAVTAEFQKLGAQKCKGGIVFSGAYDTKRYDGSLLLLKSK